MKSLSLVATGVLSLLVAACAAESSVDEGGVGDSENAIAIDKRTEDPAKILPADFEVRLASLLSTNDVGQSFGLDDEHVPYPDTYWPFLVIDERTGEKL